MDGHTLDEKITDASKTLFSYCMSRTGSREEAEDLCQDILCELVKSVHSLRDEAAFYGFLWSVAGNVWKAWCRKRTIPRTLELTDRIADTTPEPDGPDDSGIFRLRQEIGLLSERYRRATILYYIENKSCAQIADILSVSESTVKYLLFKSRKRLKEGMNMERKLGTLSYNPKNLISLYLGSGPNRFWEFMQSKIRQNVVSACYNDRLTAEQISLEIGVPLPYLEDEIAALTDRGILIRDGNHYQSGVIVIDADCAEETRRATAPLSEGIADRIAAFLDANLEKFKAIGFFGRDFSGNTLRWQLLTLLLAAIQKWEEESKGDLSAPKTAWGDYAYLWLAEQENAPDNRVFNFSNPGDNAGNKMQIFDFLPNRKGDLNDFYGKPKNVSLLCDIARGDVAGFDEYDLEIVAGMIQKGYVRKEGEGYALCLPVYTGDQYAKASEMVTDFVNAELSGPIRQIGEVLEKILWEHTPKYLQSQVAGVAASSRFESVSCAPAQYLVDRGLLSTDWHPLEMPTMYLVLNA